GDSDVPPLMYRIQHDWVRLRPGEHLTESVQIRWVAYEAGPGTVTYWVVYTPPDATAVQVNKLMQDGTYIPTEKLETPHVSFNVN
ncbi:MAG TPA: hypothetical protein VGR64_05635, partial [Terracidiphilus sp.]|nr:hypothetical protein [Terracidiphilus sp.]